MNISIQKHENTTSKKLHCIKTWVHWNTLIQRYQNAVVQIYWNTLIQRYWMRKHKNECQRSAMDFLSKYRISFLKKMMDRWSVNEVVWVVISGQSANQSVSNLIWLLVCQSCSQPLRNHPAPWHHSDQAVHKKYKKTQIQKYKIQNKYSLWGNTLPHGTAVWTLLSSAAHQNKKEMSKYEIQKRYKMQICENTASEEHSLAIAKQLSIQLSDPKS